jgi:hypothetical protein
MYELTAADLEEAGLGWRDVDPTQLRLFYRGDQQPLWIQGEGDKLTLRFYGQASESRYTRENVYWLQLEQAGGGRREKGDKGKREKGEKGKRNKGKRGEGDGDVGRGLQMHGGVEHAIATVRVEENWLYSPQVKEGDHWFWASLPAPQAQAFDITLVGVASGSGRLRLEVWASTEAPASPDHHLRVSVNGRRVADESWDGRGRHLIEADVPAGLLREGGNVVSVEAPGDTGVAADIVFIDWIEISYPRLLVARADRLSFDSPGGLQQLAGFTGPVSVFDVTDPEAVTRVVGIQEEQQGDRTAVAFQGEAGRRYLAVGPKGFLRPTRVARANTAPDLRASGNGADYVAVGPPDLLEPLQPLLDWREEQGLRVMAVPVGAVYDQFNYGLSEPEAIRAFLKYAVQSWQPAPRYLLLVGDATYDSRGYVAPPEANRLPSFLIPTIYGGETASDVRFVQLDGDLKPDLAVGRMPARTPRQVRLLVEKTLGYERQAAEGEWRHRVLTVADGQDPSFRTAAEAFIEQLPAGYQAVKVFPDAGATDAHLEVTRQLDEGNLLVAYFGHGSVTQWGKDRIFTTADGAALTNGDRVPVVLNMTCLTGLFTHPKVDSLAETLLWQAGGGAVAVLAPTSLTLAGDQSFLSRPLVEALLRDRIPTLGQAVLQAQRQVPTDSAGTRDVMQTFLLFGDPALRLAHP